MNADYVKMANLRKEKGLSQKELGEMIGTHWVTISKLERGEMRMTLDRAEKIAAALGVSPSEFVIGLYSQADASALIEGADAKERVKSMGAEIGRLNAKMAHLIASAPDATLLRVAAMGDGTVGQANALVDQMIAAECDARGLKL